MCVLILRWAKTLLQVLQQPYWLSIIAVFAQVKQVFIHFKCWQTDSGAFHICVV